MPHKPQLHGNNKGKLRQIPKPKPPLAVELESTSVSGTVPIHDIANSDAQFEVELLWCVRQLEATLEENKLQPRQVVETQRTLNILRSNAQPLVRKRQLMRTSLGDYRAKMAAEEQRISGQVKKQTRFCDAATSEKSKFIKKKSALQLAKPAFKFNFPVDNFDNLNIKEVVDAEKCEKSAVSEFKFQPSENTFKFHFS